MFHFFAALTRERPSALRAALIRSLRGFLLVVSTPFANQRMLHHSATCSKAMSSVIQIAAGVYVVAIIGFVILYSWIQDWLCGVPPVSTTQRERIGIWRLRQIMKGRATHGDVLQLEPTESELARKRRRSPRKLPREKGDKPPNKSSPRPRNPKSRRKTSSSSMARR